MLEDKTVSIAEGFTSFERFVRRKIPRPARKGVIESEEWSSYRPRDFEGHNTDMDFLFRPTEILRKVLLFFCEIVYFVQCLWKHDILRCWIVILRCNFERLFS